MHESGSQAGVGAQSQQLLSSSSTVCAIPSTYLCSKLQVLTWAVHWVKGPTYIIYRFNKEFS